MRVWNGLPLLTRSPRLYVLLVLLLPASAAAAAVALLFPLWLAALAFLAAFVAMWVLQYALFQ
jgi:uncharacterized membrane protein YjjP (DUF1212 family)